MKNTTALCLVERSPPLNRDVLYTLTAVDTRREKSTHKRPVNHSD